MHRTFGIACALALAAILVSPAAAGDDTELKQKFDNLKERVDTLQARKDKLLRRAIERYLEEPEWFQGAEGDGGGWQDATRISARFTGVVQGTTSDCDCNRTFVNGDVDLDFDFHTTENLILFVHLTANTNESESSSSGEIFPPFGDIGFGPGGGGSSTMAGSTDGIGVNGTRPTDPGSITVYEAGIHHKFLLEDEWIHWEIGSIDPRTRFGQNAFADDENTQFINNIFDDSSTVLWLSDATGRTVFGAHAWVTWGDDQMNSVNAYTFSIGWFNTPGQFFSNGQVYTQFSWKGELHGRVFNLRVYGFLDEFFNEGPSPATGDGSLGGGVSFDWWATETVGVFFKGAFGSGDVNPVEADVQVGLVLRGFLDVRPDDTIGIAGGVLSLQSPTTLGGSFFPSVLAEDIEAHLEVYYRFDFEEGRLQVTPHLIVVNEPQAGTAKFETLVIVGLRVHVPF